MQLEIKQSRNKIELFLEGDLNIALHMIEMKNFAEWTNTTFAVSADFAVSMVIDVLRGNRFSPNMDSGSCCANMPLCRTKSFEVLLMTLFPLKPIINNGNNCPLFKYEYLSVH